MTEQSAFQLYRHLVTVIDQSEIDKNYQAVLQAAVGAGMRESERLHGIGQRWDFVFTDSVGDTLVVHVRWWDQSKSFSNQPDMNVMSAVLVAKGSATQHERRYED